MTTVIEEPRRKTKTTEPKILELPEHTVEIVSDSGEGAQKCGQIFGAVSAKMGNGVWTVEIIPAEIQPPPRTPDGGSGNRIRIGSKPVTNWGDDTNLVIAFNEQVLLARHRLGALAQDAILLIEDMWAEHPDEVIRKQWATAMSELEATGYRIIPVPMQNECLKIVDDPRKGKNMFALGLLSWIYERDTDRVKDQIAHQFRKKSEDVYNRNVELFDNGYEWGRQNLDFRIRVKAVPSEQPMLVMNGNEALALGAIASGMELCAMYPITPATSASHYLGEIFSSYGGILHQAEDEIAAAGVAIGASYAGKVAFTITSGPGLALKTEFLGLSVMTETPLVVVDVQRGGPSTGLPTKVEQSDLWAAVYGQTGDAPHVVMAPATIEDCFHSMITARRIAEAFRCLVIVLTDANLATGVQPFLRPDPQESWMAKPIDLSPLPEGTVPFNWNDETGLSERIIPGRKNGAYTATGLAHEDTGCVAYTAKIHHRGNQMRSRKMAVLQQTLEPPVPYGATSGDLLVVGWGSTKGAIEESVDRAREQGLEVASLHLTFLSPFEPGLTEIFSRFGKVMTVEINYSDDPDDPWITEENRRRGQLSWMLRAQTLVDVDCWTQAHGEPLRPAAILQGIRKKLSQKERAQ